MQEAEKSAEREAKKDKAGAKSSESLAYAEGKCVKDWKKHDNAVLFGCTKEHACKSIEGLEKAQDMCRRHTDCVGVLEQYSNPAPDRFEMRSGDFAKSATMEHAYVWCGNRDDFHPRKVAKGAAAGGVSTLGQVAAFLKEAVTGKTGSLTPPSPALEEYTLQRLQYWRHGIDTPVLKWSGPRELPDRAWLPTTRKGKFFLANVDSGGFNNIRLAFEVMAHPPSVHIW